MARKYLLDNYDITKYVRHQYSFNEQRNIIGTDLLQISQLTLDLWNAENEFTPYDPGSFWYGRYENESRFELYDDVNLMFSGQVKKVLADPVSDIAKVTITSYINEIFNKTCLYYNADITPAQAFYEILTTYGLYDYIDMWSYYYSKSIQEAQGFLVDVYYGIDSTASISQVLQQLATMSGADCYFSNGKISFVVWNAFDTDLTFGMKIKPEHIVSKLEYWNDGDAIKNQYSYDITLSSTTVNISDSYYGEDSRLKWGERSYINISLVDGSNISSVAASALTDIGNLRIERAQEPQHYCKFSIDNQVFPFPFTLTTVFQFDNTCEYYLGDGVSVPAWQIISQKIDANKTEITAIKIN